MGEFVCFRLSKGGIFKSIKNVKKNYTLKKKKKEVFTKTKVIAVEKFLRRYCELTFVPRALLS